MNTKEKKPILNTNTTQESDHIFSGSIYLFYGFDMGDLINLDKVKTLPSIHTLPRTWPKHFKHFHTPLTIELATKQTPDSIKCFRANIHHFGALSIIYKIPFKGTLDALQSKINKLDNQYQNKSMEDATHLFNQINQYITQPKSFHHRNSYIVTHIKPETDLFSNKAFAERYGPTIASALRFEKHAISEFQMKEILNSRTGYYEQDLVIIDTESAFLYDNEPEELLDFFEQALVQQLELQYFDKLLDKKLDDVYNQTIQKQSLYTYLPFVGTVYSPLSELSKLRVDISVITERLDSSIKLTGEAYYSKIYELLVKKLEIEAWKVSVDKKLSIIHDVRSIYQSKVNSIREDLLSTLIIVLIMIELLVALIK
jgi:hypothetical protein